MNEFVFHLFANDGCSTLSCCLTTFKFTLRRLAFQINIYTGFCVGISIFGALFMALFLSNRPVTMATKKDSACGRIQRLVSLAYRSRDMKILLLSSLASGFLNTFFLGDFTAVSLLCTYFMPCQFSTLVINYYWDPLMYYGNMEQLGIDLKIGTIANSLYSKRFHSSVHIVLLS